MHLPEEDLQLPIGSIENRKSHSKIYESFIRDIATGSVILVEPAVVNITKEEYAERFCDFCFKNIYLRLVPCNYCSDVAYCSKDCAETAFGEKNINFG